ncbi:hypothetical protein ACIQVO_38320 [Streptomyces sp. NPDC101062]|uniref:hypothetical protein n=1 Tax=unclassified Streptomyces TaxID=2593676 RepID=UPI0037F9B647
MTMNQTAEEQHLASLATVLVDWVERAPVSQRCARLLAYRRVALADYELGKLLTDAMSESALATGQVTATAGALTVVITKRPRAWEPRMLLFAHVMHLLQQRATDLGNTSRALAANQSLLLHIIPSDTEERHEASA